MFCSQCGKEIPENSSFCGECGCKVDAKIESDNTNAKPNQEEKKSKKKVVIIAIIIVLVIGLAVRRIFYS